jgi:hypothetical protein
VFSAGFPETTIDAQISGNSLVVTQGAEFAGAQLIAYPSGPVPDVTTAYDIVVGFIPSLDSFQFQVFGVVDPGNPLQWQLFDLYAYGLDSPGFAGFGLNATNMSSDEYATAPLGVETFIKVSIDPGEGTASIFVNDVLLTTMDHELALQITNFAVFIVPDTFSTSQITSIAIGNDSAGAVSGFWTSFVAADEVL